MMNPMLYILEQLGVDFLRPLEYDELRELQFVLK